MRHDDGFDNVAFEIEEDTMSHYTATTEISETNEDEENSNNKKRNKIRTNPHIKGGTLEKKAKNKNRKKSNVELDLQSNKSSEFDQSENTEYEIEENDEIGIAYHIKLSYSDCSLVLHILGHFGFKNTVPKMKSLEFYFLSRYAYKDLRRYFLLIAHFRK